MKKELCVKLVIYKEEHIGLLRSWHVQLGILCIKA
jgi:hypothetical protein